MAWPDSSELDDALIGALINDPQLTALCPDGVWYDVAAEGTQNFVIVSVLESHDEPIYYDEDDPAPGRAWEVVTYLIKAVGLKGATPPPNVKAAAQRIDAIMEEAGNLLTLPGVTINGYQLLHLERVHRLRTTEVDDVNKAIRWYHRGGHYELWARAA